MLDIDYIMQQLSGSMVPQIGVSFSESNIDIATLNFGQWPLEAGNERIFAQNIYRMMNTILFQNPLWNDENGIQQGFDIAALTLNPQAQLKTPTEIREMLKINGVIDSTTGSMNKTLVIQRLTQGTQNTWAQ